MEHLTSNLHYWVLQTVAMMLTAFFIPKLKISGPFAAFFAVLALAFVNTKLWDASLFFQLPQNFSVNALLLLVTNGVIFWLIVKIMPGIEVEGIWPAIIAPVVFTITSILIREHADKIDWDAVFKWSVEFLDNLKTRFKENPLNSST